MNKIILSTIFLSMSASLMTVQAATVNSFEEQLMMQKKQLRPQEFNFFSDRYKQVHAQQKINEAQPVVYAQVEQSFSEQLMMQKKQLHPQEFNFFSDRYKQVQAQQHIN